MPHYAVVMFHRHFRQVVINVKLLAVYQLEPSVYLCTVRPADIVGKSSGDPDQGIGLILHPSYIDINLTWWL